MLPRLEDGLPHGVTFEQLHRIPGNALVDALVEDLNDARMPYSGQCVNLAPESSQQRFVNDTHGLYRRDLAGFGVLGPVDYPHAARTEDLEDTVRSYRGPDMTHLRATVVKLRNHIRHAFVLPFEVFQFRFPYEMGL